MLSYPNRKGQRGNLFLNLSRRVCCHTRRKTAKGPTGRPPSVFVGEALGGSVVVPGIEHSSRTVGELACACAACACASGNKIAAFDTKKRPSEKKC